MLLSKTPEPAFCQGFAHLWRIASDVDAEAAECTHAWFPRASLWRASVQIRRVCPVVQHKSRGVLVRDGSSWPSKPRRVCRGWAVLKQSVGQWGRCCGRLPRQSVLASGPPGCSEAESCFRPKLLQSVYLSYLSPVRSTHMGVYDKDTQEMDPQFQEIAT